MRPLREPLREPFFGPGLRPLRGEDLRLRLRAGVLAALRLFLGDALRLRLRIGVLDFLARVFLMPLR